MNDNEKLQYVTDYIKAGEKDPEDFTMGVEMEHFVIHNDTGKTVSYYGDDGVGESLEEIEDMGFEAEREDGHILALQKGNIAISTEPGSQFEIAITSDACIGVLEREYIDFMKKILPIFGKKNQSLVTLGYHPVTKIDEIKILPKKRYDYMYNYFKQRGDMAHNMMKGTASLQVTIDYKDEEDFKKKFRVLNALSPVFYAMFDNAYIFEGKPYEGRNIRQKIWENTDRDRSGVFEIAFDDDLSYEKYAEKILNTPLIFTDRNGVQEYCGSTLMKDAMEEKDEHFVFHGLSIVFPDVRVKRYIEVRMMDSIPYPLNFSCLALIKGLMYSEENLDTLAELTKHVNYDRMMEGKKNTSKNGIRGEYLGQPVRDLGLKLINMAKKAMPIEKRYLIYLQDLLEAYLTPRDIFEKIYREEGLEAAVDRNRVKESDMKC